MAHGTPVVITDVPALLETAGGAAEVVPVGDPAALAAAAARSADPRRRVAWAAAGRASAARHSWRSTADALWTVLRSVATTRSQR
jgi:glycosyltransferase involved in cell wall biosynthesis